MNKYKIDLKSFKQAIVVIGFIVIVGIMARVGAELGRGITPAKITTQTIETSSQIAPTRNSCENGYSDEMTQLPPDKAVGIVQAYQECLKALEYYATHTVSPSLTKIPLPIPTSHPGTNLVDHVYSRMAGNGMLAYGTNSMPGLKFVTDKWVKWLDGDYLIVLGGAIQQGDGDLNQGVIQVVHLNQYDQPIRINDFPTPIKSGLVTIVDAKGDVLTLVAQDGTVLFFDVATEKYLFTTKTLVQQQLQRPAAQGMVIENGESAVSGMTYDFTNQWYAETNGQRTSVFVGKKKVAANEQVLVVVASTNAPTSASQMQEYPIPDHDSNLRIADEKDNQIILVDELGIPVIFDLSARRFLSYDEIQQRPADAKVATYQAHWQDRPTKPTVTIMPTLDRTLTVSPAYP